MGKYNYRDKYGRFASVEIVYHRLSEQEIKEAVEMVTRNGIRVTIQPCGFQRWFRRHLGYNLGRNDAARNL